MTDQTAGQILDNLGVNLELDEGDLVSDALVLAKVIRADGEVTLLIVPSESLDWIAMRGMVYAADEILRQSPLEAPDE
ncbi:hypothetical protein NE236_41405 [Actinoallomurus purpureus]|uniref:hypothetical protein n=1 Tax=Actinoallomurus purpureus TaxID=478114 RepID=UPI002093BAE0|nr:hypothetical protein [Actinoallomurus purpureus]MCO6011427.1 hypothetical protein [Actinoallomurus purpureus]